ncbi:MAG: ATP-binding protein [Chloroflexota bacterium]
MAQSSDPLKRNNPFSEQTAGEYFVGREEEFKQFQANLDGLASGIANHAFVAGLHGAGKTSYLDQLVTIAGKQGFVSVLTNVTEQVTGLANVQSILRAIADAVEDWAQPDHQVKTGTDWAKGKDSTLFRQVKLDVLEADQVRRDLSQLWSIASEAEARGIVVCIDEGQWLQSDALSALKVALEAQTHIVCVLSLRLPAAEDGLRKAGRVRLEEMAMKAGGDIGASRLYTTEIAMGPFTDDLEAKRCIDRRLLDNAISFDDELSREVINLAARVPRDIILYAQKVYARADEAGLTQADASLLDDVVRDYHAAEVAQAARLVENLARSARSLLKVLIECDGCATDRQLAQRIQAGSDPDTLSTVSEGINSQLSKVCERFPGLLASEDTFQVASRSHFFALRIALEER